MLLVTLAPCLLFLVLALAVSATAVLIHLLNFFKTENFTIVPKQNKVTHVKQNKRTTAKSRVRSLLKVGSFKQFKKRNF